MRVQTTELACIITLSDKEAGGMRTGSRKVGEDVKIRVLELGIERRRVSHQHLYLELMDVTRLSSEMEGFRLEESFTMSCRPLNRGKLKALGHCP